MEGCDDPLELDEDVARAVDEVDLTSDVLLVRGLLPGCVGVMELFHQVANALPQGVIGVRLGRAHDVASGAWASKLAMVPFCQRPLPLRVGTPSALSWLAIACRDDPSAFIARSRMSSAALGSGIAAVSPDGGSVGMG